MPRPTIIIQNIPWSLVSEISNEDIAIHKTCQLSRAMCCSSQDDSQNQEEGRENDSCPPPNLVDQKPEEKHSEDLADQIRVRQTSLDRVAHAGLVEVGEERLHVSDDLRIVAIAEQGQTRDKNRDD